MEQLTILLTLSVLGSSVVCQDDTAATPEPVTIGHIESLESEVLGETRTVSVALPSDYERSDEPCGVVYLLDCRAFFTTAVAAVEHNRRTHLPMIVVGVHNTDRSRDLSPPLTRENTAPLPGTGGAKDFRRFLIEELRPFIQEKYRTNDLSLLIGHSLGGLFAFDTLLEQPDAFTGYLCMSPSLWWDEQSLVAKFKELPLDHGLYRRFVYLSMGDESSRMNPHFEEVVWHLKDKAPSTFRWHADRFPGKNHWTVASPSLYEGLLAFFAPITELAEDKTVLSVAELTERHKRLTAMFGVEVEVTPDAISGVASNLASAGRIDEGLALIDATIEEHPDELRLVVARGGMLVDARRFDDAVGWYEASLEKHKDGPKGFLNFLRMQCADAESQAEKAAARSADAATNGDSKK